MKRGLQEDTASKIFRCQQFRSLRNHGDQSSRMLLKYIRFWGVNLGGPGDVARREKEGEKGVTPYKVLITLPIAYNLLTKSTGRLS